MAKEPDERPRDWIDVIDRIDHLLGPGTEVGIPALRLTEADSGRRAAQTRAAQTRTAKTRVGEAHGGMGHRVSLMMKGFIAGCLLWVAVIGAVFLMAAWGCVSCVSGCHATNTGPPPTASMDDLAPRIGRSYSLKDAILTLGPSDTGVVWLTDVGYTRRRVAFRMRLTDGGGGGLLIWPEDVVVPADLQQTLPDGAVRVAIVDDGTAPQPQLLVQRRVDGHLQTLATLHRQPDAAGWYELMIAWSAADRLTIEFPDGSEKTIPDCFEPHIGSDGDADWPDRRWGVFASPGATFEVEVLDPHPPAIPSTPSDTTTTP
jgi:hypothetical protein